MLWQTLKIGGGGYCSGMDIHSDGTIVVRVDVFGAYLLSTGGSNWRQLVSISTMPTADTIASGDPYFNAGVFEIKFAPSNSNVLYMAYRGYVYKTTSQGGTWTRTGFVQIATMDPNNGDPKSCGQKMAVDPANADVCFLGTENDGLWVTVNGGTSWSQISTALVPVAASGQYGICAIAFDPTSAVSGGRTQTLIVSSPGNGVYRTTDAGTSWTLLAGGPTDGARNGKFSSAGVYYVNDLLGNNTWKWSPSAWTDISPPTQQFTALAIDPANPARIIGDWFSGRLNASYDSGATWTGFASLVIGSGDIPWISAGGPNSLGEGDISFDPLVVDKLWVSGGIGVFYTTIDHSGTLSTPTWHSLTAGQETLVASCVIAPPGGYPILGTYDRPTWRIANPNVYQSDYGPNHDVEICACFSLDWLSSDPAFIVAINTFGFGGDSGSSAYSTDRGFTWTEFPTMPWDAAVAGPGGCIAAGSTMNFVAVASNDNAAYYTLNGGTSWTEILIAGVPTTGDRGWGHAWFFRRQMVAADRMVANKFYMYNYGPAAATSAAGLYTSTDSGVNWTHTFSGNLFTVGFDQSALKMRAVPGYAGHIFICTGGLGSAGDAHPFDADFRFSRDAGVTWTSATNVKEVIDFGFGASALGSDYPSVYFAGWLSGVYGIYRSDSTSAQWAANTQSWTLVDQFPLYGTDQFACMSGDMDIYGQIYIGHVGSGFAYFGDPSLGVSIKQLSISGVHIVSAPMVSGY